MNKFYYLIRATYVLIIDFFILTFGEFQVFWRFDEMLLSHASFALLYQIKLLESTHLSSTAKIFAKDRIFFEVGLSARMLSALI